MQLKRTFLLCVIGAASTAAALGIWVLLFEHFFGIEGKVFATLGSIVLFCLPAMTCAALAERGHWRRLMAAGIACCLAALVLYLLVIWFENWIFGALSDDWVVKPMLIGLWWSLALPWMGLLTVRKLRAARFVQTATVSVIALLAVAATVITIGEISEDAAGKFVGVLGILAALGTVVVPILLRIEGIDKVAGVESTPLELSLTCPRCLLTQTVATGHARCAGCRLKFRIEVEEPRCPACNYLLHKLERPACPECGAKLDAGEVAAR